MLKNTWSRLTKTKTHPNTLRLFAIGLNIWVLINSVILSLGHSVFYGKHAFVTHHAFSNMNTLEQLFGLLIYWREMNLSFEIYPAIILLQWTCAIIVIFSRSGFVAQLVVTWTTLTLDSYSHPILDGGNNLVHLMLIYLPIATYLAKKHQVWSNPVFNLVFLTMRLQVVVVYLTAGLSKVHGELWTKGVALYYTMGVREYGHPLLFKFFTDFAEAGVLFSYATVAFQISFAFLVWNRNLRPFVIAVGTMFHLGIVFGMGLTSFGFAMCTSYLLFQTDSKARQSLNRLAKFFSLRFLHPSYYPHRIETNPLHA